MKKIPSLFKRDYDGTRLVYDEVVPGCEWVVEGEGQATVKHDGTACMVRDGALYKRYDRKRKRGKLKPAPDGWIPCEDAPNEHTGHWPGWVPVGGGPEDKWFRAAPMPSEDGTYELVGPKVQGNPYGLDEHALWKHGGIECSSCPRDYAGIRQWLKDHPVIEGIVWHHGDGRMCKIKRRDFGLTWPPESADAD